MLFSVEIRVEYTENCGTLKQFFSSGNLKDEQLSQFSEFHAFHAIIRSLRAFVGRYRTRIPPPDRGIFAFYNATRRVTLK